jgi:hypothetical protein
MRFVLAVVAVASSPGVLTAQTVSVTLAAAASTTLRADVGGLLVTQALPAGPLAAVGSLRAEQLLPPAGIAFSQCDWHCSASSTEVRGSFAWFAGVTAPPPSFADTTLLDMVMTVNVSAPLAVFVEVGRETHLSAGATIAVQRVDVGNDGSFEVTETTPATVVLGPFAVGAALPVRVQLRAAQTGEGTALAGHTIRVVPSNDLVIGSGVPLGCAADQLQLLPSFVGRGIALRSSPNLPGDLAVAVLGATVQPIVLPPQTLPCLLLPALDFTVLLPATATADLPLPAAFRPIGFWAQAVVLSSLGGLTTTNSFSVIAH